MQRAIRVVAAGLVLLLAGCPGSGAREMLETAELEEVQDDAEHAAEIYREILERYPGSPEAETARARLDALAP